MILIACTFTIIVIIIIIIITVIIKIKIKIINTTIQTSNMARILANCVYSIPCCCLANTNLLLLCALFYCIITKLLTVSLIYLSMFPFYFLSLSLSLSLSFSNLLSFFLFFFILHQNVKDVHVFLYVFLCSTYIK